MKISHALKLALTICIVCALAFAAPSERRRRAPDDCSWTSGSKLRRAVKLRTEADGKAYEDHNGGGPISVEDWYAFTCSLDPRVPRGVPESEAMQGLETVRVTLRGYLVGARFERDEDHDMQAELAASSAWDTDHVLVEIPAGSDYCKARRALWDLVRRDGCRADECFLSKPVEIVVKGYVMLGGTQAGSTDYCHAKSTRGMRRGAAESRLRGAWRLQPVFSIEAVAPAPHARPAKARRHGIKHD
jgi:hypothetical protein